MKANYHNMRGGILSRGALLILPASLAAISLAGVTIQPSMDLRALDIEERDALQRVERCETLRHDLASFHGVQGPRLADLGQALARDLIPGDATPLRLFAVTRLAADGLGLDLDGVSPGSTTILDLDSELDRIVLDETTVTGRSDVARILAFLHLLEDLGHPAVVLDAALSRSTPDESEFDFVLRLGFYHRTHLPPEGAEAGSTDMETMP